MENNGVAAETPDSLEHEVGRRVRELREARGLTQAQLGEALGRHGHGMHQTTVAKLEAAERPIRVNELAALAVFFDVPVDALWLSDDEVDAELREALAVVQRSREREAALRQANEAAVARQVAAERAALLAREELEAEWLRQEAAMAVYETLLKQRKAGRHGVDS